MIQNNELLIRLTLMENNNRYQMLFEQTEGGISLEMGEFDVTLFIETREIYDAWSLISAIEEATQKADVVRVKLMQDIILEDAQQNEKYQNLPDNFEIDMNNFTVTLFADTQEPGQEG